MEFEVGVNYFISSMFPPDCSNNNTFPADIDFHTLPFSYTALPCMLPDDISKAIFECFGKYTIWVKGSILFKLIPYLLLLESDFHYFNLYL